MGGELRVALWGGSYTEGVTESIGERFEEETGAEIVWIQGNPSENAAILMADRGSEPPFDLLFSDSLTQTDLAGQDLLEEFPFDVLPDGVDPDYGLVNEGLGPAVSLWYTGIVYNTEHLAEAGQEPPASWEDLWELDVPAGIHLPTIGLSMGTQTIASAAVVAGAEPYDLGAGIGQLAELPQVTVYQASSAMQNDFAAGNISVAVTTNGRAWQLEEDGIPAEFIVPTLEATGQQAWIEYMHIDVVRGTPNRDLAERFIEIAFSEEPQVEYTELTHYAPVHDGALETLYAKDPIWRERLHSPEERDEFADLIWEDVLPGMQAATELFQQQFGG